MSWSQFDIIKEEYNHGCIHEKAPNGCSVKTYKCRDCGAEIKHQCGNNALLGWHNCPAKQ
jgi:hypothetical protein